MAEVSDSNAVPIGYFSRPPRVIHMTPLKLKIFFINFKRKITDLEKPETAILNKRRPTVNSM